VRERLEELRRRVASGARRLPRPTPAQALKAVPVVLLLVVLLVLVGRNYDTVDFPSYEAPEGFVPRPPPTTLAPGAAQAALVASIAGTTVPSIPPNVGTAALGGTVQSASGPVPGATVRIERTILGVVQAFDVVTDAAGGWQAGGIGGGRYRVRAFLPPSLASPTAEVFLLPAGERRSLDLAVETFGAPSVRLAIAPDPALLGQPVNVAVLVTGRFVDGDGFVGTRGLTGAVVDVASSAAWSRTSPTGASTTGGDGQAVVTFTCRQAGQAQITATVRVTGALDPVVAQSTFDCLDPTTLTTTTLPGDPGATTTTAGGGVPTTTGATFPDVGD
jgi:hypothetical protein